MPRASTDTDTFNVCMPEPDRARLDALAQSTGRSHNELVAEALKRYLDDEEQQIARIQEGIADADAGRAHYEDEVAAEMRQIVAGAQTPQPANLRTPQDRDELQEAMSRIAQDDPDAAEHLAQLKPALLQAMQDGDDAAMRRIQQQIQAIHSRLHPTPEEETVRLYEDNAGALLLLRPGGLAYDVTAWAAADEGEFEYDAVAVLNGESFDQTVRTYPSDRVDLSDGTWQVIAVYDGMVGSVMEQRDESGMVLAGPAGRHYIGLGPMGDQTGYYGD